MTDFIHLPRRDVLKVLAGTGLGASSLSRAAPGPGEGSGYNVLWLMSDEHNPFVAGYAGDRWVKTPTMDDLALKGVRFTAAYTANPLCVPARRAFHAGRTGSNLVDTKPNYEALGTYFGRMGYRTAWFGKQHWEGLINHFDEVGEPLEALAKKKFKEAGLDYPKPVRGVEEAYVSYWPSELNIDTLCADQAVDYLDRADGRPFFLGVSLEKPHFPFTIQQAYYDRYANERIKEPKVTAAMLEDLSHASQRDRKRFGFDQLTRKQSDFCRKIYYGMVSYVDDQLGRVVRRLEKQGLRDRTIIVYMADHGEMLGQHGIWYKNAFFEASARVPMVLWLPPALQQKVSVRKVDAPVSTLDLFPTLCELCGLKPPATLEGQSLVPLYSGRDDGRDRVAFSENKRARVAARMIRTSEHKYCWYEDGFEQLYDMRGPDRDLEAHNLAGLPEYADLRRELKQRALDGWNKDGLTDHGG